MKIRISLFANLLFPWNFQRNCFQVWGAASVFHGRRENTTTKRRAMTHVWVVSSWSQETFSWACPQDRKWKHFLRSPVSSCCLPRNSYSSWLSILFKQEVQRVNYWCLKVLTVCFVFEMPRWAVSSSAGIYCTDMRVVPVSCATVSTGEKHCNVTCEVIKAKKSKNYSLQEQLA